LEEYKKEIRELKTMYSLFGNEVYALVAVIR
jgi:hypothetical protein